MRGGCATLLLACAADVNLASKVSSCGAYAIYEHSTAASSAKIV